jgi:hypothetical protein
MIRCDARDAAGAGAGGVVAGLRQGVQRTVGDAGERVALAWQRDVSRISAAEVQT